MVGIPRNIVDLVSYKLGKSVGDLVAEFGLTKWALLWNNENNFGPSPLVYERIQTALPQLHRYPDPLSTELREAIAAQSGCGADQVVVENGSEALIDNIFRSFFSAGDRLLTSEGTFVAVNIWARANNTPVDRVALTSDYRYDIEAIVGAVRKETKVIYISNPNNPTGAMVSREEMEFLFDRVPAHVLIILDEAYFEYAKVLADDFQDGMPFDRPNAVVFRTFSKAYALAGMRVGYALGPSDLIAAMAKVKLTFTPSSIAQAAALGALADQAHVNKATSFNRTAVQEFGNALISAGIKFVPTYGNFVMLDLASETEAAALSGTLMKKGIFVRHLKAFGLPHCIRVSTGTGEENELFIRAITST